MDKDKFKFIRCDSPEQEKLVRTLFENKEKVEGVDPDEIINDLEFLIDSSFRRGSWGDYHQCYQEYIIRKCPLSVLLIMSYNEKAVESSLKEKTLKLFKGEFAQYFSTFEGKDSNSVTRFTFRDFHLGHLMVGFEKESLKELLATDDTCGEFEVQHKSSQYNSSSKAKYEQGHFEKISNCRLKEMKELNKKIDDRAENRHVKTAMKSKKKF